MFYLSLDDQMLVDTPDSAFKVLNVPEGSHELSIALLSGKRMSQPIHLESGTEYWFEVVADSSRERIGFYNTFPMDQSDTITVGRTILKLSGSTPTGEADVVGGTSRASLTTGAVELPYADSTFVLDSAALDSISRLDFSLRYKGRRGCNDPVRSFDKQIERLQNEEFNSRRLSKAKSSLSGQCLTVEQIDQVLSLFEFEDHKLEILQVVKPNVFDLDNVMFLSEQFALSRNQENFNELFELHE